MANKTARNDASVDDFIAGLDEGRREDCAAIREMMTAATGDDGAMWGDSIVGFGEYHYVYDSGREGDWFAVGFSPRKQNLTLYLMDGAEKETELLADLGKHTTGKACLYIKRLSDIDTDVLQALIERSVAGIRERYG